MRPPRLRLKRSTCIAAFLAPIALAVLGSFLLVRTPAALYAPFLGPWAGCALGHGECTFARFATRGTFALCLLGPGALIGWLRLTDEVFRELCAALLFLWTIAWFGAGVLSVLNTTS